MQKFVSRKQTKTKMKKKKYWCFKKINLSKLFLFQMIITKNEIS